MDTEDKKRVEESIVKFILTEELPISVANSEMMGEEFQSYINLMDSERDEKEYDWMSDIRIPEFASQMLTQSSIDIDYFRDRDFTEVYLQDEGEEARLAAEAAKELLNRTLNQRKLHHYLKFVRAKMINHLCGRVYAICWWDKRKEQRELRGFSEEERNELAEKGIEAEEIGEEDKLTNIVTVDRFNYDIIDPRDVFTSREYRYSLQEKNWVVYRTYNMLSEVISQASRFGYINIDKLKKMGKNSDSLASNDELGRGAEEANPIDPEFELYTRFGKFWVVFDKEGKPGYGIGTDGEPLEDAEMLETIITFAKRAGEEQLIRFGLSPFKDSFDQVYKPIIRGLCYVHPTFDGGLGDGKLGKDLQTAVDDTFNMGNDRVRLATTPTFVGRKGAIDGNDSIYIEPEHIIELDNINEDLRELGVSDNIQGSMAQLQMIFGKMNQVMSIYPTTMGQLPGFSSTTATAVAGSEQRTNMRGNYKAMTFEYTFLVELYWMIQQMTWAFAEPDTAVKLMGEKVYDFNPGREFWYKPVSQSIESDNSKNAKIKIWTQILNYVAQLGHPDTVKLVNYILERIFTYLGDDAVNFGKKLLNPEQPIQQRGGEVGAEPGEDQVMSNQNGTPQSQGEIATRAGMNNG